MRMTREGRRILGLWVAALVIGGLVAAGLELDLLPILSNWVMMHATSVDTSIWAYQAMRAFVALVTAVAIAGPAAFVLGRRLGLQGIEVSWIAASALAAITASLLPVDSWLAGGKGYLMLAPEQPSLVVAPFLSGAVAGCVFGIAQAIALKPYIRGAAWWIPVSIGARAVAGVATSVVTWQIAGAGTRFTTLNDAYAEEIAGALLTSLVIGVVTGLALVRLLGESNRDLTDAPRPGLILRG
jgi:hypothetical protein